MTDDYELPASSDTCIFCGGPVTGSAYLLLKEAEHEDQSGETVWSCDRCFRQVAGEDFTSASPHHELPTD